MVAAENSGIKSQAKLREYLYKNPEKLALKLAKLLHQDDGTLLPPVRFKGNGIIFCYSVNDKIHIAVPRDKEYYLMPWADDDKERCYVYSHHTWQIGVILKVFKDQIEFMGFN